MPKRSAGVVLYRRRPGGPEVLLVHPGGPVWAGRDLGAWSIPKGEMEPGEDPEAVARRELAEETGLETRAPLAPLASTRQPGGKVVVAFALEGELDPAALRSNTFRMVWPPGSGRERSFPEVDRAEWFPLREARRRILGGQVALLDELERRLAGSG